MRPADGKQFFRLMQVWGVPAADLKRCRMLPKNMNQWKIFISYIHWIQKLIQINLRQLRIFVAAARHGSTARAALAITALTALHPQRLPTRSAPMGREALCAKHAVGLT